MTTGCSDELKIIKTAILNEHEGYQFYQMAAGQTKVQEVREVFLSLAEEEKKHEQYLRNLYETVLANKSGSFEVPCAVDSPNLFNRDQLLKESPSLLVSALSVGVMMEEASIEFYKEAAKTTKTENARKLYLQLADWENEHFNTLEQAYDFAREEWWAKQGFSPA